MIIDIFYKKAQIKDMSSFLMDFYSRALLDIQTESGGEYGLYQSTLRLMEQNPNVVQVVQDWAGEQGMETEHMDQRTRRNQWTTDNPFYIGAKRFFAEKDSGDGVFVDDNGVLIENINNIENNVPVREFSREYFYDHMLGDIFALFYRDSAITVFGTPEPVKPNDYSHDFLGFFNSQDEVESNMYEHAEMDGYKDIRDA